MTVEGVNSADRKFVQLHSDFADANMVAKISTNVLIKPHTEVELAMNKDKILIFDESCGDRI